MTDAQWADWSVKQFGPVVTLLALFIFGLVRKWWVLGWQYEEKHKECGEWKTAFFRVNAHADKALDVASKSTEVPR